MTCREYLDKAAAGVQHSTRAERAVMYVHHKTCARCRFIIDLALIAHGINPNPTIEQARGSVGHSLGQKDCDDPEFVETVRKGLAEWRADQ